MSTVLRDSLTPNEAAVTALGALKVLSVRSVTDATPAGANLYTTVTLAALNSEVDLDVDGMATVGIQLSGTFSATLSFFASNDGINFTAVFATNAATFSAALTATTAGVYLIPTAYKVIKVRATTFASGAVAVSAAASPVAIGLPNLYPILAAGASSGATVVGSVRLAGASLSQSVVGAAGAAATLSLPAGGSSTFQYLSTVRLEAHYTGAVTGTTSPVIVTLTNLGLATSLAFSLPTGDAGDVIEKQLLFAEPLRASTANAVVSFAAPATPNIAWCGFAVYRVNA